MPQIAIVIPCYNESERLAVNELADFLETNASVALVLVNDGSSDDTLSILQTFAQGYPDRVLIVDIQPNKGKAEAVRQGLLQALSWKDFCWLAYFDADLATPLSELALLYEATKRRDDSLMAFGARVKRLGANIERKFMRHYLGRVFATVVSFMLKLPVYDSQCGAKLLKASILHDLLAEEFISRWFFDVEIFIRLSQQHGRANVREKVYEVPLNHWQEVGNSKIKMKDFIKAPIELWKINRFYKKQGR